MTSKVPTKSARVSVRFPKDVAKKLTKFAAREGLRRATWARKVLLEHTDRVLNGEAIPLTTATTALPEGSESEVLLIRLSDAELKRVSSACKKEGLVLGVYARAVCMWMAAPHVVAAKAPAKKLENLEDWLQPTTGAALRMLRAARDVAKRAKERGE